MSFTAKGVEKVVTYAASAARDEERRQLPPVPVHMSGPFEDVHYRPMLGAAPMASLAGVLWGAQEVLDLTRGTARGAAGIIERPFRRKTEPANEP